MELDQSPLRQPPSDVADAFTGTTRAIRGRGCAQPALVTLVSLEFVDRPWQLVSGNTEDGFRARGRRRQFR